MEQDRDKTVMTYRKAQSLIATVLKMLEEDRYCVDVMQQNLAVMGLLRSAHRQLLDGHLHSCFRNAMETGSEAKKKKMIAEMLRVATLSEK